MTLTELPNFSREQQYQWEGMCSQAGAAELRLQAQQVSYVLTLPQLQQAFVAILLPKSKGTTLPFSDPLPRAGIVLGEETGAVGRDRGSAVALRGDAGCLLCWGLPWHCSPEAPEAGVATERKEPADRQCLLSSLKEDAGRREMHLVLRIVCAKRLLEKSGAVCLLSGGVFLSEPCWLLDLKCLFVETLKWCERNQMGMCGFIPFVFWMLSV